MEDMIYLVVEDEETIIRASLHREYIENLCEEHAYENRERAIQELGLDGDGNEKDISDADLYADQYYPVWQLGQTDREACEKANGEDVTVYFGFGGELDASSTEILQLLEQDDADEDYGNPFR